MNIPACPQCAMENTYPDGNRYVCADCGHEWSIVANVSDDHHADAVVKDANGELVSKVVKVVPNVNQRLGFSKEVFDKIGLPGREVPECKKY